MRRIVFMIAALCGATFAAQAADKTVYETRIGNCLGVVEADEKWHVLSLRRRPVAGAVMACRIDQEAMTKVMTGAFAALAKTPDAPRYESLFLGRIEYSHWLSNHLVQRARNDPDWNAVTGWPAEDTTPGAVEAYVERVLAEPAVLAPLNQAAGQAGYRITGLSCEKVLVSSPGTARLQPSWVPPGLRVPYDALCWLALGPAG